MSAGLRATDRELYRWQLDALVSWLRCGRRGVIEAVTGSGKTDVAIAAAGDAMRRGRFVLVLVPSRVLMEQWHGRLAAGVPRGPHRPPRRQRSRRPDDCDVLVATRHSAAAYKPLPGPGGGLLIADECHGLGGSTLRRAMLPEYEERLGLTATLERSDDAVTDLLLPYFGGICYRYGFEQGIADGVCARPRVAFVGVPLADQERADYLAIESAPGDRTRPPPPGSATCRSSRSATSWPRSRISPNATPGPTVAPPATTSTRSRSAARSWPRPAASTSSSAASRPRSRMPKARSSSPRPCAPRTTRSTGSTPTSSVDLITGSTGRARRREILDDLRDRKLDAVAAPRVLDEGIDVPDANLGVVMSASRTRRQMIQRMGRILRRKRAGVAARFVIMFAKDTLEDPAHRIERDGFLDEIERISEATGVFDGSRFDELDDVPRRARSARRAGARAPRALRRGGRSRSTSRRSTR